MAVRAAKLYIGMTTVLLKLAQKPPIELIPSFGAMLESFPVYLSIFVGDAEGRPMTVTKIANYTEMPRSSIYRVLERLLVNGRVKKDGRFYRVGDVRFTLSDIEMVRDLIKKFDK